MGSQSPVTRPFLCGLACIAVIACTAAATASARTGWRPSCEGRPATQLARSTYIVAKPHAVLVARGTRDHKIVVKRGDHTRHVICGGPGNDEIQGGAGDDILIGGAGNDFIKSGPGKNLVVGDNYNLHGDAIGSTGRDKLIGGSGRDVIVGDNLGSGGASGGKHDHIEGKNGSDTLIGDDAVTGCGTAVGGGEDILSGAHGNDFLVGDSFSLCGTAIGGGADVLNSGHGSVLMIGDSASLKGTANGGGNDALHGATGGDHGQRCKGCKSRLYGDSYALTSEGRYAGAGNDLLTAGLGHHTYLDGMGSNPGKGGRGDTLCAGNRVGHTVAAQCDRYLHVQDVLKHPELTPPRSTLRRYGNRWPLRGTSPRPR